MDWDKASKLLSEDLDKSIVKTRVGGGGKTLSYIDHFGAIDTANRIFGHGGWSRHTVHLRQISDKPIAYMAKVRITVGEVVRDGYGYGADPTGKSDHEKALKEAETDATKRALMTFGYPLGLALYQKEGEREHVSEGNGAQKEPEQPDLGSDTGMGGRPSRHASNPLFGHLKDEMDAKDNLDDLNLWWVESGPAVKRMNPDHQQLFFIEMMKKGFDIAPAALDLRQFLLSHKTEMKALEERSKNKWEEVGDFYDRAKDAFKAVIDR